MSRGSQERVRKGPGEGFLGESQEEVKKGSRGGQEGVRRRSGGSQERFRKRLESGVRR